MFEKTRHIDMLKNEIKKMTDELANLVRPLKLNMIRIEAGEFVMGSPLTETGRFDDEAQRHVTINNDFFMSDSTITQAQYEAVMGKNPSYFEDRPDCPVESVSYYDAVDFCIALSELEGLDPVYTRYGEEVTTDFNKNGYRLPTEEEWEYACRAGSITKYPNGDSEEDLDKIAWYAANSDDRTHNVKGKEPNAWGLYDMLGNVWEWTETDHIPED